MTDTLTPMVVDSDQAPARNRRAVIAAGAVGALVLAGGGYLLLSGGSSSNDQSFVPPIPRPGVVKVVAKHVKLASKAVVKPAALLPASSVAPLGRDPFKPLYIQPVAAPVSAATAAPAVPTSTGTTQTSTTTTPAGPVATTYALSLTSVYGSGSNLTGSFKVGAVVQQAKAGSVFGKNSELRVISLQQESNALWTAVVQVGDDQPFNLAQKEVTYVR